MNHLHQILSMAVLLACCNASQQANAAENARRPDRFAIIFNLGYAGDHLPRDKEAFEKLIGVIKQAHFNTVLCKYEDWRAEICKKHDVQIMVDLLVSDHHIYKNVEAAKKLCESLKGNEVVYGYHLWSDNISSTYPGRSRDVKNVHTWDGTHAAYVGSYRMSRVSRVEGMDLFGYYDFHWHRGGHWGHLNRAWQVGKAKDALFLRYCDPAPGLIGKGNPNRAGYTIATSIPFGLKGYTFHNRGGVVDSSNWQLGALGKDLQKVNANLKPLEKELLKIGNPSGVYSTKVTKTSKDRPTGTDPAVPGGLAGIPEDHWLQISSGEVLFGMFKDKEGRDVAAFASHNAYQPQKVTLEFKTPVKTVSVFDRKTGKWGLSEVGDNTLTIDVAVFATELVRFER